MMLETPAPIADADPPVCGRREARLKIIDGDVHQR